MKVHIIIEDDDGKTFEGSLTLLPKGKLKAKILKLSDPKKPTSGAPSDTKVEFSLSARPFVKKHGARSMAGPKKFALLLAWMTKGVPNKTVDIQELITAWNKMTQLMGSKYNPSYSTRAKDNGWVDIEKTGKYKLLPSWKQIFGGK